jgi:MoaA/NifB/PqqE/SkfB family radical SAM enzyme
VTRTPSRVIVNFTAKCNMRCDFCYIPFDGHETSGADLKRVVARLAEWGVSSLTFGGGDPMMYPQLDAALELARSLLPAAFLQLDTNGLRGVRDNRLERLAALVDLVGLPIDGVSTDIEWRMRRHRAHLRSVVAAAEAVTGVGGAVKVNTVVTRVNLHEIGEIGRQVARIGARIWSLYEFWAIGPGATAGRERHALPAGAYAGALRVAREAAPDVVIEAGEVALREAAYFFVTDQGDAYCTGPGSSGMYTALGSLFDDAVLDRWDAYADMPAVEARFRPRMSLVRSAARP